MKKEMYVNNMKKYLNNIGAGDNEKIIIINIYVSYLDSFFKRINNANKKYNIDSEDTIRIFNKNFEKNVCDLIYYKKRDDMILNYIKDNIKNIDIIKLNEQPDLIDLKMEIVNDTYNREIYCLTKCFNYKRFSLKLYALANILGIESYINKITYSDKDKKQSKYPSLNKAISAVE